MHLNQRNLVHQQHWTDLLQVILILFIAWICSLLFASFNLLFSICYLLFSIYYGQVQTQPRKRQIAMEEVTYLYLHGHNLEYAPNLVLRDAGDGRVNAKHQHDLKKSSLADFDQDNIAKIFVCVGLKTKPRALPC